MPFLKLQFKPGLNRDQTNYSAEGSWYECDKIRFRAGYPQKLGGWAKATPNTFIGVCRQMWNWATTYGDNLLAVGTNEKVYIEAGGYYNDITPLRTGTPTFSSPTTNNAVGTTNGTTTITFTLAAPHLLATGDYVQISGVAGATIGGVPVSEINGNRKVTVVSATVFSIVSTTSATSPTSAQGGTAIVISCELSPGYPITVEGYGWGTGTWGRNAWGLGSTTPVSLPQRDWWFDNFDNDLVMNIRNGTAYWWERGTTSNPSISLGTRAISLQSYATAQGFSASAVPVKVMQLMVSQQDKHLLAFGSVPFGSTDVNDFDPMLIRWADQDTPADWAPSVTNSAGDLRVSRGSRIVRAIPTRQEVLVWTDTSLYTLQFLGTTDVFGLQEYADNVSLMSPRAMATASNVTYWMGQDKFYTYAGRVDTLPCTLRDHVFSNINLAQSDQVICGTNEQWNEVWWFYPTATSDYNNAYVVYNHLDGIWYYGSIDRTAWLDTPIRNYPQAANSGVTVVSSTPTVSPGYVYNHEYGVNADDQAMDSYIQSADFDLDDGEQFMLTRRVLPDITFSGSIASNPEITFQLRPRNFPGSRVSSDPADTQRIVETTVGQYTDQIFVRARARQMALKIRSDTLNVNWQLGSPRLDVRPDGKR